MKAGFGHEHVTWSGSDDEDLRGIIGSSADEASFDYSIDTLLDRRQIDLYPLGISLPIATNFPDAPSYKPPMTFESFECPNPSVFDPLECRFQSEIIDLIHFSRDFTLPSIARPFPWQLTALNFFPELVPLCPAFLYSLIQEAFLLDSRDLEKSIIHYVYLLPAHSIDYDIWIHFVLRALEKDISKLPLLLSISNISIFNFSSPEQLRISAVEIVLLSVGAILCPPISNRPDFHLVLRTLRVNLASDVFDEAEIAAVIHRSCEIVFRAPIQAVSYFVSLFPLEGLGVRVMFTVGIALLQVWMGLEQSPPALEDFVNSLGCVRALADSTDEHELLKLSAVLALTEKIIFAAAKGKIADYRSVKIAEGHLRFAVRYPDATALTALKEQLHVTRVQLELLMQSEAV
jgi:hypothetical protein